MNILALETSGKTGSVAALTADQVLDERSLSSDQRSAQSLAPALLGCLAEVGWRPHDVDLTAVTTGPGSFTGLRVGVTTAKTFAYAAECEVLGLDTLRVTAAQAGPGPARVCAVIDGQREQLFAAWFQLDAAGHLSTVRPTLLCDIDQWLRDLPPDTTVTGTGLGRRRGKLLDCLPARVRAVDPGLWSPRAATVGRLAWLDYQQGRRDDFWQLVPQYFRKSAAEEKWERREAE